MIYLRDFNNAANKKKVIESDSGDHLIIVGSIVKHFKRELTNNAKMDYLYKVIGTAKNTETGEDMVIYEPLYKAEGFNDVNFAARPIDMFMSHVDSEKYPDVKQEFRFEMIQGLDVIEFDELHEDDSKVIVTFNVPKEVLAFAYTEVNENPTCKYFFGNSKENNNYISGKVQYIFDKDDSCGSKFYPPVKLYPVKVLMAPVYYFNEENKEVIGNFVPVPNETLLHDVGECTEACSYIGKAYGCEE